MAVALPHGIVCRAIGRALTSLLCLRFRAETRGHHQHGC